MKPDLRIPELRITATDAATVFTGAANVQRFDAPSAREIAAYVRNVLGPAPGGAVVHVSASPARLRELADCLADYDVELVQEQLPAEAEPSEADPDPPTDTWEAAEPDGGSGRFLLAGVVVAVAAATAAALYFTVLRQPADPRAAPPTSPAPPVSTAPSSAAPPSATSTSTGAVDGMTRSSQSKSPMPETVRLERDGLSVELPADFVVEADGEMWRAVGGDPNFRLQLAVEEIGELPARTMAEQLVADIAADPDVELVDTDAHSVTYLERAADGSQALWKTWPEGRYQAFVGCHTRFEATASQLETCKKAMHSARLEKISGTDGTGARKSASNT